MCCELCVACDLICLCSIIHIAFERPLKCYSYYERSTNRMLQSTTMMPVSSIHAMKKSQQNGRKIVLSPLKYFIHVCKYDCVIVSARRRLWLRLHRCTIQTCHSLKEIILSVVFFVVRIFSALFGKYSDGTKRPKWTKCFEC